MNEVSCRVLQVYFRDLKKKNQSPDVLVEGTGVDLSRLLDRNERIDWNVFCRFIANTERVWSDEELVELGGVFLRSPYFRPFFVIARLMFTAEEIYRWINDPEKGIGRQLMSCIRPRTEVVGKNRLRVELQMEPGYELCRGFFLTTKGALKYTPLLVGSPPAEISMKLNAGGAVYDIRVPEGGGLLRRLRLALVYPFTMRNAARELRDAHEMLVERYGELSQTRDALARQTLQLETAHRINQAVRGSLELDDRVSAIADALIDVAQFSAVELLVSAERETIRLNRHAVRGSTRGTAPIVIPLERHEHALGELRLWPGETSNLEERRELLEFVTPIVSVALEEALAYTALSDYRENLDRKVVERTAELVEAQRARDRIFANVNHEIRTPLSLILLSVEELRRQFGYSADSGLNTIEHSTRQLLRLVDGLLLLAARQEGKLALTMQTFDVGDLLSGITRAWQPAAASQGVNLQYEGPASLMASLDTRAIERIVTNLLSNALKFSSAEGNVRIALKAENGQLEIIVTDTGRGIDAHAREHLFERFAQGETPGRTGTRGSGIGLALVKELAEAHGGRVSVHSVLGRGSQFCVKLPFVPGGAPTVGPPPVTLWPIDFGLAAVSDHSSREFFGPEDAKATILVVEDDAELRVLIAHILSKEYRVLVAPDGITALTLARDRHPDLLVSDIAMPGLDGIELTRKWRELPDNSLAPVVLLTAYGGLEDRLAGFDAGAVDFMLKPFEPLELLARVRSQLEQRSMALRLLETEHLRAEVAEYKVKAAQAKLYSSALEAERKQKDMQQQYLRRLISSQEEERRRIAGDLHDSLGQELVVIKIRAMMALRQLDNPENLRAQLEEIAEMTGSVMQSMREISHNLRPAELERLGLTATLRGMFASLASSTSMEWNIDMDSIDGLLGEDGEIMLYRILQEAANNIVKHAEASVADVKIACLDREIHITVIDNGQGFIRHDGSGYGTMRHGFGLRGMQERVRMLGGSMQVETAKGKGARIAIALPLSQENAPQISSSSAYG